MTWLEVDNFVYLTVYSILLNSLSVFDSLTILSIYACRLILGYFFLCVLFILTLIFFCLGLCLNVCVKCLSIRMGFFWMILNCSEICGSPCHCCSILSTISYLMNNRYAFCSILPHFFYQDSIP